MQAPELWGGVVDAVCRLRVGGVCVGCVCRFYVGGGTEIMTGTTFQLYVQLGNDAMRTASDLSAVLRKIADDVDSPREMAPFAEVNADGDLEPGWFQTILDVNGNDVGRYAVKEV